MNTLGITVRPIKTIAGDEEFAEVFFDAVRVPIDNVVGEIGGGWKVATSLLDEERMHLGTPALTNRALVRLQRLVQRMPVVSRNAWQSQLEQARAKVEIVTAAFLDTAERFEAGVAVANESSYLKILNTETVQWILELVFEAAGALGARQGSIFENDMRIDLNEMFLQSRRLTIYGGSNEIQRSIVANRVLGLSGGRT